MNFSAKQIVFISFMLFSMFFGAGNLIFPPFLGQSAGTHLWTALAGFIVSAVGLPILGVIVVAKAGSFNELNQRVHPFFAFIFPFLIYIAIGPGLAIPRAGSLAFEMGLAPFLPEHLVGNPVSLLVYSIIFFGLVAWLCMFPSKLIDLFGKLLTPILLALITIIFIKSLIDPIGSFAEPKENYEANPVFQGVLDGYLTMDALAALAFGIVIANTLKAQGVIENKKRSLYMMYAGLGAGLLLTVIYLILGYLGAASSSLGQTENGAQILSNVMTHLFGQSGTFILGLVFTIACFCVSIGLVTSCSQFFANAIPKIDYKKWVIILSVLSTAIANLGLTQILQISVPILGMIYPLAIVIIFLGLIDDFIKRYPQIYIYVVSFVALFSIIDTINKTFLANKWSGVLDILPFYMEGLGWIIPALIGLVVGFLFGMFRVTSSEDRIKQ
ncbi:branched-chain amino acid transport system II carrier protein [Bacillus sp. ISL-40]|uniref:branched-chain amino acid transport system II carrier protein n=1 Tax=unclassified Bacillus (in: firmicutes) TaxID=185979 RepID=UPI001BE7D6F0|nr:MULTISPECIES: branched-chain amino acid transport system II carrier protein [unclassified Bacillus (in: firmicutes)]MBT2696764.1 branched-chain amino acid transport system II carrier protein [Bacillus sp. ISL-40]MBT2721234.1 branched-chain amino acid transport system II carrier protein [Bacillus sp. ISL-46]MBT2740080.1 branched-chain amino acid transport system II carrier protein [Bacillus sp. ISL-77]